ncbi:MAG: hypothetical protein QG670_501 [Thermoproteota archaeon]|nr:hypothetical protein [Thermoproteota archaeon]
MKDYSSMTEILRLDYNEHVSLIGTAHFTRRSINEAIEATESSKPKDIGIELDWKRYRHLNEACVGCPKSGSCKGLCEFTGATNALGNTDANIWLLDMTEDEMNKRMERMTPPYIKPRMTSMMRQIPNVNPVRLWEMGYKEAVVDYSEKQMEKLRSMAPWIPRVLIDERNALMAARLAWVVSKKMDEGDESKVLAFVGAAHVKGIRELLSDLLQIKMRLQQLCLSFAEPRLIRRVAVQET